jgi:hypothetical protein
MARRLPIVVPEGFVNVLTAKESDVTTVITVSEEILRIIEGEFLEMPGMRLTEAQFQRLWTLAPTEYLDVTAALIDRGVIARDAGGRYCRRTDLQE